jgi:hypothetical protein
MNNLILQTLQSASPARRALLVGNVRSYVSNADFVNLISGFDVNDVLPANGKRASNLHFVCRMLTAFNGVPGLEAQVRVWLG